MVHIRGVEINCFYGALRCRRGRFGIGSVIDHNDYNVLKLFWRYLSHTCFVVGAYNGEARCECAYNRAVVKSTFVESKTNSRPKGFESESSPSPKRFESESRPSPKRFESKSSPSPKRFESKSSPSPNETVKTEKEKNYLLQNHILNYW